MCTPIVTKSPDTILVTVEHPDLAIYGARRTPVAVRIECDSLYEVLVAMRQIQVKACLLVRL